VPLPGIGDLDGDNGRLARGGGEIVELLEELAKSFKGKRDWPGNKVRTGETRSKDKLFSNKKFMDDLMALFRTYGIVPGRPATRELRSCKLKVSAWIEGAYNQLLDYFDAKIAALERQISFVESTGGAGPGRSSRTGPLFAERHRWRQELELLRARLDALLERARSVEEPPPADNR